MYLPFIVNYIFLYKLEHTHTHTNIHTAAKKREIIIFANCFKTPKWNEQHVVRKFFHPFYLFSNGFILVNFLTNSHDKMVSLRFPV